MPYEYLDHPAPVGGRIHFRRTKPDDDPAQYVARARLAEQGIAFAYVQADTATETEALNSLGQQLGTDNPPYDPHPPAGTLGWYRFMDDLETLSEREGGMVIVVDHAADLFCGPSIVGLRTDHRVGVAAARLAAAKAALPPCFPDGPRPCCRSEIRSIGVGPLSTHSGHPASVCFRPKADTGPMSAFGSLRTFGRCRSSDCGLTRPGDKTW